MENINFENEYVHMRIEQGILFLKYEKDTLDLECATNVVQSRLSISNGVDHPLFVDISHVRTTTKEARNYSSHGDAAKLVSATALWGSSELTRLMANFFLAINKPAVPVKFFSDKAKALQWLKQYKHIGN